MSILATIQKHSGRVYRGIQAMLATSMAAATFAAVGNSETLPSDLALAGSMAASAVAFITLMYMRHSVVDSLRSAAAAETEKHKLLSSDSLTGAMTRRYFLEALRESLGGMRQKHEVTLVLIDLDHFKELNDTFGHQFGDVALTFLVSTAKRLFPDCPIGRLGGDEFGLIVRDNDLAATELVLRQFLETLRAGLLHEGNRIALSASIGMAMRPGHASQATELMRLADLALYESKAAGRGCTTVFDEVMLSEKRYRRLIERELRAAVYLNQFELHYQPVVGPQGKTFAFEGLLRWRHPVRGLVAPSDFIPVAERTALIDMLGEWVFKRACADIAHFPGCQINLNVSGEQLRRDEIVRMARRVLAETGRSASQFVIEITETVATSASPEVLQRIKALRELGFHVALDDFGTGHCGFNYLKTLPIDSIKIDRSYIRNLATDEIAQVFVSALAQIARIQNVTIVAEGIETAEEFTLARAAGCDRFQGYLFSRPLPRERLTSLDFGIDEPVSLPLRLTG